MENQINNIEFVLSELELPIYVCSVLNGTIIEGSMVETTGSYGLPTVTVSDPDENGYLIYTITVDVELTYDTTIPYSVADHTDSWLADVPFYYAIDYYTGTIITWHETDVDEETPVTIESDDGPITIYVNRTTDSQTIVNDWENVDSDNWEWTITATGEDILTIRVPQDYDGLILGIPLEGSSQEYLEAYVIGDYEYDLHEGDYFGDDVSGWQFTKISDLLQNEQENVFESEETTIAASTEALPITSDQSPQPQENEEDPYQWMYDEEANAEDIED